MKIENYPNEIDIVPSERLVKVESNLDHLRENTQSIETEFKEFRSEVRSDLSSINAAVVEIAATNKHLAVVVQEIRQVDSALHRIESKQSYYDGVLAVVVLLTSVFGVYVVKKLKGE